MNGSEPNANLLDEASGSLPRRIAWHWRHDPKIELWIAWWTMVVFYNLFGLLFFVPILGLAVGAAMGAAGGALTDVGIDDEFIASVRSKIQPGTSALFVMSSGAVIDKVKPAFAAMNPELIHSNLSAEQEGRLREVFSAA